MYIVHSTYCWSCFSFMDRNDSRFFLQVKSLSQQLSEAHKEVAVLSHSLADRSAELQIETNKVRCLELELEEGNITMEKQAAQLTRQESAIQSVRQVLGTTESWMKTFGAAMEEALAKLASCSQRVNFASGRVRFLQGQQKFSPSKNVPRYDHVADHTFPAPHRLLYRPLYQPRCRPHTDCFTDHIPTALLTTLPTTYRLLYRPHSDLVADHKTTALPTT